MVKKPTYIDLFAGCGGLSLGLHNAGWQGLFAIEKSTDAFETLRHNLIEKRDHFDWPDWLNTEAHDIKVILRQNRDQLLDLRGNVDMVTGGPPCQGFSTAGKRDEKDRRNKLITDYLNFIDLVRPKILFFENVRGFTLGFDKNKSQGRKYSTYVIKKLQALGYRVAGDIVNFSEFGVPQKRCRFILVGIRKDVAEEINIKAVQFFQKIEANKEDFLASKNLQITTSLHDAISDLLREHGTVQSPDTKSFQAGLYSVPLSNYQHYLRGNIQAGVVADSHRFVNHKPDIQQRFKWILDNCERNKNIDSSVRDERQLKKHTIIPLASGDSTPTLTTLPDDFIHYSEARILTVREYARIQSFPDNYEFKGKYTTGGKQRVMEVPRYTQIGNAIPPLFGEQSGLVLLQLIGG